MRGARRRATGGGRRGLLRELAQDGEGEGPFRVFRRREAQEGPGLREDGGRLQEGEGADLIVLVDGFSNKDFPYDKAVDYLCKWTRIPELASKRKWATIIVPYGENLYLTDSLYDAFQVCINDAFRKYGIKSRRYIIGGLSAGGTVAVGFAEAVLRDKKTEFVPKAVFAVDPVLDLAELYRASEREAKRDCKVEGAVVGTSEARFVTGMLDRRLGDPVDSLANYVARSPYTMSRDDGGNARYLRAVPVRVYHELDPMWSMKERCRPIGDENGIVGCQFIHNLYTAGNTKAEVVLTQNRGSRLDGTRHPHSWNIVEENGFIAWAKQYLANPSHP
jgi:hypothetical protein